MAKYHIYINQYDFGVYEAVDMGEALDKLAQDAGYKDWETSCVVIEHESDLNIICEN